MANGRQAYVSLLTSVSYLPGVLVLGHSLRASGSTVRRVLLCSCRAELTEHNVEQLQECWHDIRVVEPICSNSRSRLQILGRPELDIAPTKLWAFDMLEFDRVVYVDADTLCLRNMDELFDLDAGIGFAAVPDVGWPDIFNTGLLVLTPNRSIFEALNLLLKASATFDGSDQGLLNQYFTSWHRLPFTYNVTPNGGYEYTPAYLHYMSQVSLVHFIGPVKPWHYPHFDGVAGELQARWVAAYRRYVECGTFKPAVPYIPAPEPPAIPTAEPPLEQASTPAPAAPLGLASPKEAHNELHSILKKRKARSNSVLTMTATEYRPWDPLHEPPPANSQPEAANFPTEHTENWTQPEFQPPARYPTPTKYVHFELPPKEESISSKPAPIFPWEASQVKAERVFPVEEPEDVPESSEELDEPDEPDDETVEPMNDEVDVPDEFITRNSGNAWDAYPDIIAYANNFAHLRLRVHAATDSREPPPPPPASSESAAKRQTPTFQFSDAHVPDPNSWDPNIQLEKLTMQTMQKVAAGHGPIASTKSESAESTTDPPT